MSPSDSDLCCSDEELRKKYDLYGEDGLKDDHFGGGQNYQSWHYFNEEFGKTGFSNFAIVDKISQSKLSNGHTFDF
jgi:DnaJ-class molecular chaperone